MSRGTASGPVSRVAPDLAYRRPRPPHPVSLTLDGNEGLCPSLDLMVEALRGAGPGVLRRYPDVSALEAALAQRFGVEPSRVLVTAGADEAIDRCCRAFLGPDRSLLMAVPGFEMLDRYAALAGADLVTVPWRPGAFPTREMLARLDERTAIIAVVSPNNPTGEVATLEDVQRLAAAAPHVLILLDHAYVEYADHDLTRPALVLPNVVVTRTFSKAWGLAGCRVGFALGPAALIAALRAAGGPYPVAGPSVAFAAAQLERGTPAMAAHVARVRQEREVLSALLTRRGAAPRPSQANFVYADFGRRAGFVHGALAAQGILVRNFPDRPGATTGLRITLPGDPGEFARLTAALELVLAPDALLLDLDGVLADVAASRRAGVFATARLIVPRALLEALAARLAVGIVTGRPRAEAEWLLTRAGIGEIARAVVALEDAPRQPDPAPVLLAMRRLGARRTWMAGVTPDAVRAARAAGALPLGVTAPGEPPDAVARALLGAGAALVLDRLGDLEGLL